MEYLVKDLPDSFLRQATLQIQSFTTILIRIYVDELGKDLVEPTQIGSGTFVYINGLYGILTAQHVSKCLSGDYCLGLMIGREEEEQRFSIEKSFLAIGVVGKPLDDREQEFGPDLSFIAILDSRKVEAIKTFKSFLNLSRDKDEMLTNPLPLNSGVWFACGAPNLSKFYEPSSNNLGKIESYILHCGVGGVQRDYNLFNYDYLEMDIDLIAQANIPPRLSGMSGGGIWQVTFLINEEGVFIPQRYLFSGVLFYEIYEPRFIRGHGRKSIYKILFEKWPHLFDTSDLSLKN